MCRWRRRHAGGRSAALTITGEVLVFDLDSSGVVLTSLSSVAALDPSGLSPQLAAVASPGVLNTIVLMTRERVHDLGVFKAVGMTPRQVISIVVITVAATGLIAVSPGTALQQSRYSPSAGRPGHRGCRRARPRQLGGADAHGARTARGVTGAPAH